MRRETCWLVSCYNYGHSQFFCEHGDKPKPSVGQQGSEAGCYS